MAKPISLGGGDSDFLDHRSPLGDSTKRLIPASIPESIVINSVRSVTSQDVVNKIKGKGALVDEVPVAVYRASAEGKPRRLDNSDVLVGYKPLYDGLSHFQECYGLVKRAVVGLKDLFCTNSVVDSAELQDLDKITMQRWRPTGWFLHVPFSESLKLTAYEQEFINSVRVVVRRYAAVLKGEQRVSDWQSMILNDFDPPDTMVGMPTMMSGNLSHEGRIAILAALAPVGRLQPEAWLDEYSRLSMTLGLPANFLFSSMLATRHGPMRKPIPLWVKDVAGYSYNHESIGLYDRTRFVYPIPYPVNFLLSPVYLLLKEARKRTLGLWHDPVSMEKYVKVLRSQGKKSFSIDFSGMDTTMPPHLIKLMCSVLIEHGFPRWPLQMLSTLYERMGIITPSYLSQPGSCTFIHKVISWLSGFKLTSEFDTIFGAATMLTILEQQMPGIRDRWERGNWTFAELGDDIIFTTDSKIDPEAMTKAAQEICGANLKVYEDVMFLKRLMPLHPDIPHLSRPFSRLIQQTFFNEERYDGIEGGQRPDAVMRLSIWARMDSLDKHPKFRDAWPLVRDAIASLGFVRRSSAQYQRDLLSGKAVMQDGDEAIIQLFATRTPEVMLDYLERSRYEPSAAFLLQAFKAFGVNIDENPDHSSIRKIYMKALLTKPGPSEIRNLTSKIPWMAN